MLFFVTNKNCDKSTLFSPKHKFHLTEIYEVKKGAMGADCLHVINEFDMQNCGTIYYESKITKSFSENGKSY